MPSRFSWLRRQGASGAAHHASRAITIAKPLLENTEKRIAELRQLYEKVSRRLKNAPGGILRVLTRKKKKGGFTFNYYLIEKKGDSNGKCISNTGKKIASAIAQRDYDKKLKSELARQIKTLEIMQARQ